MTGGITSEADGRTQSAGSQAAAGGGGEALVGCLLGDYKLVRQLPGGGMAWVYEAASKRWPRRLVVKVPAGGRLASVEARERFARETQAAASLSHPNIAGALDFGEWDDVPYLVMKLLEGRRLDEWLAAERPTVGARLTLFSGLCRIVASVHREGKIHRDLKPGNILVDAHGELHLLDFGLVRSTTAPGELTGEAAKLGTPSCMAPEQVSGRPAAGPPADVYALGVILHWLLTGRYPIDLAACEHAAQFWAIMHQPPTAPGSWNASLPPLLDGLVLRCLSKEPQERSPDAAGLLAALEEVLRATQAATAAWTLSRGGEATGGEADASGWPAAAARGWLESTGGAVPLDSPFYLDRPADTRFLEAANRRESVILIHGPRQIGKTSLLARGLRSARRGGAEIVLVDCQGLNTEVLDSLESLYRYLGAQFADQLGCADTIEARWDPRRPANLNFERFLIREALQRSEVHLVWAMDEVDRLFKQPYQSEFFGMLRSWHNARALNPAGPWGRLTLALAYAAEARLFITDLNQSPFNIGVCLELPDFDLAQLQELNRRHQQPLASLRELARLQELVGGHPYLARVAFNYFSRESAGMAGLESVCLAESGPFASHLRHLADWVRLAPGLQAGVASLLAGRGCEDLEAHAQLRSAGLVTSGPPREARFRCGLYQRFFQQQAGPAGRRKNQAA